MDRKAFLKRCVALTTGVACLDVLLTGCASLSYAPFTMDGTSAVVQKADLGTQGFALLKIPSLPAPVFLARLGDGTYAAVVLKCTHRGCTVQPAGSLLQCPCHGSQYSWAGVVRRGPAPRNLPQLPLHDEADRLRIDLSLDAS